MSKIPLFIISSDEVAPLPQGTLMLDVPANKLHLFSSVEIEKTEYVIVGIAEHEDPYFLLENPEALLETLFRVGVLCTVVEREAADEFSVIKLQIKHRVLIRQIERNRSEDNPYTIWVTEEPVTEEFTEEEESLKSDITKTLEILLEHAKVWLSAGAKDIRKDIQNAPHVLTKMSIVGEAVLQGESRMSFLQQLSNFDRWSTLLAVMGAKVKERKTRTAVVKKKKAKPKPPSVKASKKKKTLTWREKVQQSAMPNKVKSRVLREVSKLENTPKNNSEYAQAADYLNWAISLPWGKSTYEPTDLRKLRSVLDETHYGLDEVKEHMLEIMCTQELQEASAGTVLCFTGPPGTGKTSIAKAIAKVSNRPLIQIALGGIADTAELRGHRRTYVAARPGRIITELRDKASMTPLILLDEVDKLAKYRGDPASALLELLDPEQNSKFVDHYLEVPIDLSKAMFICTANDERNIPQALLDRMEIIRFRLYKKDERKIIADQFMLPLLKKTLNTKNMDVSFDPEAMEAIYNVKSVRAIDKILAKGMRKGITNIHVYGQERYVVTEEDIKKIKKNYGESSATVKVIEGFFRRKNE